MPSEADVVYVVTRYWWDEHENLRVYPDLESANSYLRELERAELHKRPDSRWGFAVETVPFFRPTLSDPTKPGTAN